MRILVVDDNINSLQSLCLVLKDLGHEPTGLQNPTEALAAAQAGRYPLVITDIRMPGMDGLELLSAIKSDTAARQSDVVLITGHADMTTAVEALRKGAYDYLNKPINARELSAVVDRCAEHQALITENTLLRTDVDVVIDIATKELQHDLDSVRHRLREIEGIGLVIAESPAMCSLMQEAAILHSDPTVAVLIEGETGTGKEVFARYVHYGDDKVTTPFMAINCAAIPHELFESELFGHEPGAFTGSRADGSPGKLEQAGKGTLFLDEVAEMPLTLQPKLLRVLEERSFYRVGGVKKREFLARIVCAGNRNMPEMVAKGAFRRDLYHRLQVGHLLIPPLRERPEDIRALAEHFLRRESLRKKKSFTGIAPATMAALIHYPWPGNVRELENTLERAILMNNAELLRPEHIQFLFHQRNTQPPVNTWNTPLPHEDILTDAATPGGAPATAPNMSLTQNGIVLPSEPIQLEGIIDSIVLAALDRFEGNKSKAADYLGISRFALHRRVQHKDKN